MNSSASVSRAFERINLNLAHTRSPSEEGTGSLTPTPMEQQKMGATKKRKDCSEDIVDCEFGSKKGEGFMV